MYRVNLRAKGGQVQPRAQPNCAFAVGVFGLKATNGRIYKKYNVYLHIFILMKKKYIKLYAFLYLN